MEIHSIEDLNKLTITKLKELAKQHDIHKGISKYKVKNELVNYMYNSLKDIRQRESDDNLVTDVFEKMKNEDIQKKEIDEIDEIVDNFEHGVRLYLYEHEKKPINPKYYYRKYDYLNNNLSRKSIEILLGKRFNFGDIIQFNDYRALGCFIISHGELIKCSETISDDICIPLEISKEFENPIELYKDIHNDFYGIELTKDDKYIVDKLGSFEAPEDWKYYYVNQDIYENEIHIDIGFDDLIQLYFVNNDNNNKYLSFVNSIDFVKKLYDMSKVDTENYGLYVTLNNEDDENLTEEEKNFIYNIKIPDYSLMHIEFQTDYYEIRFTYLRKEKEKMIQFINNYYFEKSYNFVKEIEPIIDE